MLILLGLKKKDDESEGKRKRIKEVERGRKGYSEEGKENGRKEKKETSRTEQNTKKFLSKLLRPYSKLALLYIKA